MGFLKALFSGKVESTEDQVKEKEARNFDVLKYDGVRAMRTGQLAYAQECFQHALEYHDDLEVREHLSDVLTRQGDIRGGLEQLRRLIAAEPDNIDLLLKAAYLSFMEEEYEQMLEFSNQVLALNANYAEAYYLQARAQDGMGNSVAAVALLTQAIALNESYGNAYLQRAGLLLKMGDAESAQKDVAYLLEHVSDNEDVFLMKARVEKALRNGEEALHYYNKVIETNPFCVEAFRERGALRLEQGDKDGATEDMRTVLELDPDTTAGVTGDFTGEGIEEKVRQAYRNVDPLGIF